MEIVRAAGHLLGDLIHIGVGQVHNPAHVPDDAPGGHGTKRNDLGHMVVAVLSADVVHHLTPAGIAKVHVNIRHTHPLRVQEPLKVQVILHRVNVGDVEAVADHRPRRAAPPGPHGDSGIPGEAHKIGDNEEVVREAHLFNHVLLVLQLCPVAAVLTVPGLIALVTELFEIGKTVVSRGQLELRQMVFAEGKLQIAHLRDLRCILQGPLILPEQGLHLRLIPEIKVLGFIAHPVLIVQGLAGLNAQQHVMGLSVLLAEVVRVVGADQGQPGLLVNPQQASVHHSLIPNAVILELQVKTVRPKDFTELQGVVLRIFILAVPQTPGNFPRQTGGEGDQSAAVTPQQLLIHPGTVVEALCPSHRDHVREIPVPLCVLAQQNQVTAFRVKLVDLVKPGAALGGDINLAADNGLDPLRLTGPVKVNGAVHNPVVSDGTGGLPHGLYDPGQVPDTARAIQKAVLRMNMQMDKGHITPPQNMFLKF